MGSTFWSKWHTPLVIGRDYPDEDEGDDHRNKTYECNEIWKMPLGRMDDHCYEFQNTGSCTKRNGKFLHLDLHTSYQKEWQKLE